MSKVNKKMKKVAAAIAVATLSMSMSMGVFASSPVDPSIPDPNKPGVEEENKIDKIYQAVGTDKDGNKVTAYSKGEISKEVEEILKDEEQVKNILEGAGYEVKEDQEVVVLGAGDLHMEEMPEGGVDLNLSLFYDDIEGVSVGDTLYILHQKADGTWEILEGTVNLDSYGTYYVSTHFDSLSPVAIVKIMSDGKVAVLDKNEQQVGTLEPDKVAKDETSVKVVKTTTVKASPKTGN